MALDIYWIGLLVLVPTVAFTAGRGVILRPFRRKRTPGTSEGREKPASSSPSPLAPGRRHEEIRKFRWTFLQVYLLVMGSEWLQVSEAFLYLPIYPSIHPSVYLLTSYAHP